MKKEIMIPVDNAILLVKRLGMIENGLKISEREALSLLEKVINGYKDRLENAKKEYRKQAATIEKLSQQQLWRFESPKHVPPDFRAEYLRSLKSGEINMLIDGERKPLKLIREGNQK